MSVTISELADIAGPALVESIVLGEEEPRFTMESDSPSYEQRGEPLSYVLQEELEIDEALADDLIVELCSREYSTVTDGGDAHFDPSQNYERADAHPWELVESWREFCVGVQHRQRFFDRVAEEHLIAILGAPDSLEFKDLAVREIDPSSPSLSLFRARIARTPDDARRMLASPSLELGPPPFRLATPGRMNAGGIPVFYGAFSEEVALAEVRPSVGAIVPVAKFTVTRKLRLLDLPRIGQFLVGSIFAPRYHARASRARFLRQFHRLVTQPIQPHDELIEYVPTQVVAEFVRNVLGLDGIIYGSTQTGLIGDEDAFDWDSALNATTLKQCNVVIFADRAVTQSTFSLLDAPTEQTNAAFPIAILPDPPRTHRIASVAYTSDWIDVSDERGPTGELPDF